MAGVGAFVLGPLSGYVTVRWAERVHRLGGVARARAVMAERRDLVADLQQQRRPDRGGDCRRQRSGTSRPLTS